MLAKARNVSERFHMFIHVGLSLFVVYFYKMLDIRFDSQQIMLLALMSVLPDAEHLVFFSTYGRKKPYTLQAWEIFKKERFRSTFRFLSKNHKTSTSLYLHNLATPCVLMFYGAYSYFLDAYLVSAAALVLASHYFFDVAEDILMMGKINPNWFFKFNRPSPYNRHH